MRNVFIIIMLAMSIILTACSDSDSTSGESDESNKVDRDEVSEEESDTLKVEKKVKEEDSSLIDIEVVFGKMAEASKDIKSVVMSGNSNTKTTMAGVTEEETAEMVAEMTLEPLAQHITITTTSGEGDDAEIYLADGDMYMQSSGSEIWLKMYFSLDLMEMVSILQDAQLDHLTANKDSFELTDDGDNYVITYIGSADMYKDIFYNEVMRTDELASSLSDIIEDMEITGSMEMKVSKDTFYVVEQTSYTETKMNSDLEMDTIDEGTYTFTDYNKIDVIVVPDEVINNAQDIPGMPAIPAM